MSRPEVVALGAIPAAADLVAGGDRSKFSFPASLLQIDVQSVQRDGAGPVKTHSMPPRNASKVEASL